MTTIGSTPPAVSAPAVQSAAQSAAADLPTYAQFSAWPATQQIQWLIANGQRPTLPGWVTLPLDNKCAVLVDTTHPSGYRTVRLSNWSDSAPNLSVQVKSGQWGRPDPLNMSRAEFQAMDGADQVSFVLLYGKLREGNSSWALWRYYVTFTGTGASPPEAPFVAGALSGATNASLYPDGFATSPRQLDPSVFLSWSGSDQRAYFDTSGQANMLTVGQGVSSGAYVTYSVNSGVSSVEWTFKPLADVAEADFQTWSKGSQKAFIEHYASVQLPGAPAYVYIGKPWQGAYWRLSAGGVPIRAEARSTTAREAPVSLAQFQGQSSANGAAAFTSNEQALYLYTQAGNKMGAVVTVLGANFLLSADGKRVQALDSLTKQLVEAMPPADLQILMDSTVGREKLEAIGYTIWPSGTAESQINGVRGKIRDMFPDTLPSGLVTTFGPTTTKEALVKPFIAQLDILEEQIKATGSSSTLVDLKTLNAATDDLKKRAQRLASFAKQPDAISGHGPVRGNLVVAWSDVTKISEAHQTFWDTAKALWQAEDAIAKAADRKNKITGAEAKTDLATMIFAFQLQSNIIGQSLTKADTEELRQINALVQLYTTMQTNVNQVLGYESLLPKDTKPEDKTATKYSWFGANQQVAMSSFQLTALSLMFDGNVKSANTYSGGPSSGLNGSPIEEIYGITRPVTGHSTVSAQNGDTSQAGTVSRLGFALPWMTNSQWSQFGNSLSSTISIINQHAQTKMNAVNSADKESNRHFELANTVLSKMNDMLQSIGRNVA
ncbi:hypothetical protein NK718_13375 [Alsobacter sp. SYSU M60028]|uniref:Uncharacterized protein n=1 Tax=Alsobacter ponti TaxID=2962936 RepID=A0ABT1LDC3_9HYPH|nr:hypothetical protein [Alsobacter ponti]MCP8939511.1 hypothetical protein [Alsobacter ponti]